MIFKVMEFNMELHVYKNQPHKVFKIYHEKLAKLTNLGIIVCRKLMSWFVA